MNKTKLLLIPLFAIPLFSTGCSSSEKENLTFGRYYYNESSLEKNDIFKVITYDDVVKTSTSPAKEGLETKIKTKKETLLLATYQGEGSSCGCFNTLKSVVKNMNTNVKSGLGKHYLVYLIATTEFGDGKGGLKDTFGMKIPSADTVTFSIFTKGVLTKQWLGQTEPTPKLLEDPNEMAKTIEEYVKAPNIYLAEDEATLDSLITKKEKMVIYFGRTACPDCTAVNSSMLYPYLKNNNSKTLFMLDMDQYRYDQGMTKYQEIKDKYHLSVKGDAKLGYSEGVVPSFVYLQNAQYADELVVYNDTISKDDKNQYTITDSYFNETRKNNVKYLDSLTEKVLIGKIIPEEQLDLSYAEYGYYSWKHEYSSKTYQPFFNAFMDKYL